MRLLVATISAWMFASGCLFADSIEDCDRLAGEPVAIPADVAVLAAEACSAAIDLDASARLLYQYARALESLGEKAAAERYYGWAFDDGFPAAGIALDRLGKSRTQARESDPDALSAYAASLPQDAAAIAQAMSRDFAFLPTGAGLRTPEAVLALRRGSSPDLARLLSMLVVAGDQQAVTRFGMCRPGQELAAELAAALMSRTDPRPVSLLETIAQAKAAPDLSAPVLGVIDEMGEVWTSALREGAAEAAALEANLSGVKGFQAMEADALADALTRLVHVVVEVQQDKQLLVLDPVTGQPFDPARCVDYETASVIPESLIPQVEVVLTAHEDRPGAGTVPRDILRQTLPLQPGMVLAFAESWGLTPPDAPLTARTQNFTPVLIAGTESHFGDPVVMPLAPSMPPDLAESIALRLSLLFADDNAAQSDDPGQPGTALRRITLQVRLLSANAPEEVQTLVLIDRPDPEVALPDAGGLYPDFLQLTAFSPLDGSASLPGGAPGLSDTEVTSAALTAKARLLGQTVTSFDLLRRSVFADMTDAAPPRPLGVGVMLTTWSFLAPTDEEESFRLRLRQRMLRPAEPVLAGTGDASEIAAAWAVASVIAERVSVQLLLAGPEIVVPRENAVAAWADAREAGPARLVSDPAELGPLSETARALMAGHLAAGKHLLLPALRDAPVADGELAFWIVDPAAGIVEDQFADGGRNESAERTLLQEKVACRTIGPFARYSNTITRGLAAAAMMVQVYAGIVTPGTDYAIVEIAQSVIEARQRSEEVAAEIETVAAAGCGAAGSP